MKIAAALAVSALTVVLAGAQAPSPQPTFRGGVDLVQLDVSVIDRNRRPVRGLTLDDFAVFEDGTLQKISTFSAVDVPSAKVPSTLWLRDVAPDVASNAPVDRRLVFIVLDDATLQASPRALTNAKAAARQVIDRLGSTDLASVVFTLDNRNAQELTSDRARLLTAVDKVAIGQRDMGGPDDLWFDYSADVVANLVKSVVDVPQRRKILVYIGQGVPLDGEMLSASAVPGQLIPGWQTHVFESMKEAFRQARHANVNIYTIDPCGLRVPPGPPPWPQICVPGLEVEYLQTLSENTGGRAIINTDRFEDGIGQIFEENGSYYLLGYQPLTWTAGRLRRIEVRVNRPGLEVRTRDGYLTPTEKKVKAEAAASPLVRAVEGVRPVPDISLRAQVSPFLRPGTKETTVAVVLNVRQVDLAAPTRVTETLNLEVRAFTVEGRNIKTQDQTARAVVRPGASGDIEYEVVTQLDLPPGRYNLRFATRSGVQNKSGSLYVDVDIPDFAKAPLSMSGLLISAAPHPPSAPSGGIPLIPVIPTARREFARTDAVSTFWRIYQGGKAAPGSVSVITRVQNADGLEVFSGVEQFPVGQFIGARSVDQRMTLPIERFSPGEYLLTSEARMDNASTRRAVRFSVF